MNRLLVVLALVCGFSAAPAHAQFYRNNGISFQGGWLGLGSTFDGALNAITGQPKSWNVVDQPTLGIGYFSAIGYSMWFDNQVALGGSVERITVGTQQKPVFSLSVSSGLRYNFMDERVRPFLSAHVLYLQLINVANADLPQNLLLGGQPFWVGLQGGGGLEWIFGDEQGVQIEAAMVGLIGFNKTGFLLPAATARLSYNVYF